MALESKVGRDAKVTIGAHTILGLGTWTISGGHSQSLMTRRLAMIPNRY